MLPFKHIYLDSNILLAEGWPKVSTSLENLFDLANKLGATIFLLSEVERELEEHWLRTYEKALSEAQTKAARLSRLMHDCSGKMAQLLTVPDTVSIRRSYRQTVSRLVKNFELKRVHPYNESVQQFFEMAIRQQLPFKEKGSGFQDAVILLAIVHYAANSKKQGTAFLSNDSVFSQEVIESISSSRNLRISLFRNVNGLNDVLVEELRGRVKDEWTKDIVSANEAVEANRAYLEKFITENFEIPERIGLFRGGKIIRLTRLTIVDIEAVHTPTPWAREESQTEITISTDILVKVYMIVERRQSESVERLIKVGVELPPSPPLKWNVVQTEESRNYKVEVEIRARLVNGKYEELIPISVRQKTQEPLTYRPAFASVPAIKPFGLNT